MIPVKLRLRNFLCYRDDVPPLSFEGLRVVCLSGDNGNGKSALLDAITWCLWGKARVDDRELIHFGRTEMEVEFEFELGNDRYRVIRKRSFKGGAKGKQTQALLDFQIFHDGSYRSIAGNGLQETSQKIIDTLRMNYEVFINSAFLRQGRADEFALKTSSERKQVLGEILGLRDYDDLARRANEEVKRCELMQRELAASIREIDKELGRRPEYEAQLAAVQNELKMLEASIAAAEGEAAALQARKRDLDAKDRQRRELEVRIAEAGREIDEMRGQIEQHERRIREYEEVLTGRREIEEGYEKLAEARRVNESLNEKLSQLMRLKERESVLSRTIAEAKSQLLAEEKALSSTVELLEKRASQAPSIEQQIRALRDRISSLQGLDARRDEKREILQASRSQAELVKMTNAQLRKDIEALNDKLTMAAKAGALCPLCESDLGPSGRDKLVERFQEEKRRIAAALQDNSVQINRLENEARTAQEEIAKIEKLLREREALQRQLAMSERSLADARDAWEQLVRTKEKLERVRSVIECKEYAQNEQLELAEVYAVMSSLGYNEEEHRRIRDTVTALQRYEAMKRRLDVAVERIGEERVVRERAAQRLSRWQDDLARYSGEQKALTEDLRELPEVEQRLTVVERQLETYLSRQGDVRQRLGQAQQMLNHCRYLEAERARKIAAQAQIAEEEAIYRELSFAFGKKGVQAMIIDSAIPEIEDEANALLARMTDGRLHVVLETQEARIDGGITETLEIKVGDELGLRSYDTYSGGEAFRINFALRIALSKLLARRAGAPLQTLVIDEGFGTLDVSGRDSLVDAINAISDDFEKIIVITHIQELKDAFPARIDVVKDLEGSKIIYVS